MSNAQNTAVLIQVGGELLTNILVALRESRRGDLADQLEAARVKNERAGEIWAEIKEETKPE